MRKRSKLKRHEYQEIYEKYFDKGWKKSEIAKYLGRTKSSISRALKRDYHSSPLMSTYEKAMHAFEKSQERMRKSRRRLRLRSKRIRKLVIYLLSIRHWSPEEISDFLKKHGLNISAKAIYNFIKKERPALKEYLYLRGKLRKQRVSHPRSILKTGAPEKKSIHERPEMNGVGHWQIDTIHSKRGGKGGVLSLKELESKRSFYFLIPDLTSKAVMKVLFRFFHAIPNYLRQTLTSDNGSEFAELYKLEIVFRGFGVYYCDPYKAYQRAAIENSNGELRWYYPKKTDFSLVTETQLRTAEYKINSKPIKSNKGNSPIKVFNQFLKKVA